SCSPAMPMRSIKKPPSLRRRKPKGTRWKPAGWSLSFSPRRSPGTSPARHPLPLPALLIEHVEPAHDDDHRAEDGEAVGEIPEEEQPDQRHPDQLRIVEGRGRRGRRIF